MSKMEWKYNTESTNLQALQHSLYEMRVWSKHQNGKQNTHIINSHKLYEVLKKLLCSVTIPHIFLDCKSKHLSNYSVKITNAPIINPL